MNEFVIKNGYIAQKDSVVSGSLVVTEGITGDLTGTASSALTASYALFAANGGGGGISAIFIGDEGTTQGTASYFNFVGAGVTATVSNNTASISIEGGGGGGTQGLSTTFTQSVAAATWSFYHNLNTRFPLIQVYDDSFNQITPQYVSSSNASYVEIGFGIPTSGYAVASNGGTLIVTGSNVILDQSVAAATWSFVHNLNTQYPIFQVFDASDEVVVPEKIVAVDSSSALIYFPTPLAGKAVASFAGISGSLGGGTGAGFPFSGSAVITGSFLVSESFVDFSLASYVSGSFTGSLQGIATSASFATYAVSASNAPGFTVTYAQATPAATWSFTHNLNTRNPIVQVYDSTYKQIIPNEIVATSGLTTEIRFDYNESGYVVFSNGGGLYITGSTSQLNQEVAAATWSFQHNLNSKYVNFEVYDSNDLVIIPAGIRALNSNQAELYFSTEQTGIAVANFSGISGSTNAVTASYALTATSSSYAVSSSYGFASTSASYAVNATSAATASYANAFTVAGTLTAQTLVVQTITSSVDFVTGSTRFGSTVGNTHQFTGSVSVSGSAGITGALTLNSAANSIRTGNELRFYRADNAIYTQLYDGGNANGFVLDNRNGDGFNLQSAGTIQLRISSTGVATFSSSASGYGITLNHTSENLRLKMGAIAGGIINIQGEVISNGGIYPIVLNYLGGNVGIGTSSPNEKLDVNGAIQFRGETQGYNTTTSVGMLDFYAGLTRMLSFGANDSTYGGFDFYQARQNNSGGRTAMRITSTGNVLIGTTTSDAGKLQIQASENGSLYGHSLLLIDSSIYKNAFLISHKDGESRIMSTYGGSSINSDITFWTTLSNGNQGERMRITSSGYVYLGKGWGATAHRINLEVSQGNNVLVVSGYSGANNDTAKFMAVDGTGGNAAASALWLATNSATGRSITAGGAINASGTDYAEYMTKAISDVINKGDIVGINSEAKLTNIFADAISFVVKSTDPSYVGGDIWGNEDVLGKKPERTIDQTEEEFAPILAEFEAKLEAARAKVDRIAFSGQVPCNVTGANVGDYIIPIELENGKIGGQAVTNPSFEQYQISVGKVWKIMEDGRAWIAVKIG